MVKKASAAPKDAEAEERRRLRSLAFSSGLLQRGEPAVLRAPLPPSTAVTRLQGRDILRRGGQRKSRFLFFPGLLAPVASAGRIGELADLGTKNPLLYLEFPQGRMKLFGTHVYPKNNYLTLQDQIVFSEAWWVGTKEENPQELKLDFRKDLKNHVTPEDCDFRGGAGAAMDEATGNKPRKEIAEPVSPKFESNGDASEDSGHKHENSTQTTSEAPSVRQSARTTGRTMKNEPCILFGWFGLPNDILAVIYMMTEKGMIMLSKAPAVDNSEGSFTDSYQRYCAYIISPFSWYRYTELSSGGDSSDSDSTIDIPEGVDGQTTSPAVENERQSKDIKPADSSQMPLPSKTEPLVQATLSSMFKKAEEKKGQLLRSSEEVQRKSSQVGREVEEDEIEELSGSSQDKSLDDDSDEDWAA